MPPLTSVGREPIEAKSRISHHSGNYIHTIFFIKSYPYMGGGAIITDLKIQFIIIGEKRENKKGPGRHLICSRHQRV